MSITRTTHNIPQGEGAWHQHRASHFNASEAAAMMGASKYRSRVDLLREKATGVAPEVSEAQQRLFDAGHAAEAKMRPVIELAISDDLYPVTMSADYDGLRLSASLDGLNLDGNIAFEAKLWNEKLAEQIRAGELEPHYYWQLEHQLLCSGAEYVIFATGDGAEKLATMEYRAVPGRAASLVAGWRQFAADLAAYQSEPVEAPRAVGRTPETLPALRIEARGMVTASNLAEFKAHALAVLGGINRQLRTDEDFANAESTVKWCSGVEGRLESAKANVLAQMADVDAVCRTIDDVAAETRRIRLELDRLVKAEKEARKTELVRTGVDAVRDHYNQINATLREHAIGVPVSIANDIGASIKGLKTLSSMRDKIDAAVATAKITASQNAERVRACIAVLAEQSDYAHLFHDRVTLCSSRSPEDLRNLVSVRIAEHKQREAEKLDTERARIRAEEAERIERESACRAVNPPVVAIEADGVITGTGFRYEPIAATPGARTVTSAKTRVLVKLGDLNAAIAPLSITGEGLAQLGFHQVAVDKNAKLYDAADFPRICEALVAVLRRASMSRAA
jgi:putative phage-type endonuclease